MRLKPLKAAAPVAAVRSKQPIPKVFLSVFVRGDATTTAIFE